MGNQNRTWVGPWLTQRRNSVGKPLSPADCSVYTDRLHELPLPPGQTQGYPPHSLKVTPPPSQALLQRSSRSPLGRSPGSRTGGNQDLKFICKGCIQRGYLCTGFENHLYFFPTHLRILPFSSQERHAFVPTCLTASFCDS